MVRLARFCIVCSQRPRLRALLCLVHISHLRDFVRDVHPWRRRSLKAVHTKLHTERGTRNLRGAWCMSVYSMRSTTVWTTDAFGGPLRQRVRLGRRGVPQHPRFSWRRFPLGSGCQTRCAYPPSGRWSFGQSA
eukprot:173960-Prorocentrum_minimum.AAC.2